jgi:DNA-binding XRE family transcriptional regulator
MSNVLKELKAEITRLARKEIAQELAGVKKINASQRGHIAELRRQIGALQKDVADLKKTVPARPKAALEPKEPAGRFWITGKGVKALRKRLGLTQAQFGKLADVSHPTVVKWEGSSGKLELRRKATVARLQAIRGMGKKQAAEIVGKDASAKAKAPGSGKKAIRA